MRFLTGERVLVDDQRAAFRDVVEMRPEAGRIERHEYVGGMAGGVDVLAGESDLEGVHARQRTGWGADLRVIVRQAGEDIHRSVAYLPNFIKPKLQDVRDTSPPPDGDGPTELRARKLQRPAGLLKILDFP